MYGKKALKETYIYIHMENKFWKGHTDIYIWKKSFGVDIRIYVWKQSSKRHTTPEASWRRAFDPYNTLQFDLYH